MTILRPLVSFATVSSVLFASCLGVAQQYPARQDSPYPPQALPRQASPQFNGNGQPASAAAQPRSPYQQISPPGQSSSRYPNQQAGGAGNSRSPYPSTPHARQNFPVRQVQNTQPQQASRQPAQVPAQRHQPQVPFTLTPQQQQLLTQVLTLWEKESDKIKTYKCPFDRWEYDPVFGPGKKIAKTISTGHIRYTKPDKGEFRINEIKHYDAATGEYQERKGEFGEHWVCDGETVFEYNFPSKELRYMPLPENMRGKDIAEGPLPFLFGAKREKLERRFWIRVTQMDKETIWLEVYPKFARDAANYQRVELILDRKKFLPMALQVYQTSGQNRTAYKLGEATINSTVDRFLGKIQAPSTPLGWKKVRHDMGPTGQDPRQAQHEKLRTFPR